MSATQRGTDTTVENVRWQVAIIVGSVVKPGWSLEERLSVLTLRHVLGGRVGLLFSLLLFRSCEYDGCRDGHLMLGEACCVTFRVRQRSRVIGVRREHWMFFVGVYLWYV